METVIKQCEQWTDNEQENYSTKSVKMYEIHDDEMLIAAEPQTKNINYKIIFYGSYFKYNS